MSVSTAPNTAWIYSLIAERLAMPGADRRWRIASAWLEDRAESEETIAAELGTTADEVRDELEAVYIELSNRAGGHGLPLDELDSLFERYEVHYDRIGRWRGAWAGREARSSELGFWINQGDAGLSWILKRLRSESHGDILDGAANLLADLSRSDSSVSRRVVEELEAGPPPDAAIALLESLGWMERRPSPRHSSLARSLEASLEIWLKHPKADVRMAAAQATRFLPAARALRLLKARQVNEADADVREQIDDEISRRPS